MTASPPDRWFTTDLPVLRQVALDLEHDVIATTWGVAKTLGMPQNEVARSLRYMRGEYVNGVELTDDFEGVSSGTVSGLTPKGLRTLEMWPTEDTMVHQLIAALERAIEKAPPDRRKWYVKMRDHLLEAPQDAGLVLLSALVAGG